MEKSENEKWFNLIEIVILVVTLWVTLWNSCTQYEYFKLERRPWVSAAPYGQIIIYNNRINCLVTLKNTGNTPALNLSSALRITQTEEYAYHSTPSVLDSIGPAILFPDQESEVENSTVSMLSSETALKEIIKKNELYLHVYIRYYDVHGTECFLKATFKPEIIADTENGFKVSWGMIFGDSSKED